jgi:acetyl esterase/lipase
MPLWPAGAPGAKGSQPEDIPTLAIYQPPADKATGAAVVVCPGGGYRNLADHEGHAIAVWLNSIGVTGIVLKYRLGPRYQHPAMMNDVLRAIRTARAKAAEWKIDPARIAVMGFSAGGHLASTAATHFDDGNPQSSDPIERFSSRPDLAILCYPVITLDGPATHRGSRQNLLGENPPADLVDLMSNEKQVTSRTPPTFFFHTQDDSAVPVENSLLFAAALRREQVPYELHVYEKGRHGVGLAQDKPALATWPTLLENWLRARNFLTRKQVSGLRPASSIDAGDAEIEALIGLARAAPPEFAADSLLRIAESNRVKDRAKKIELIEDAYRFAADAQNPLPKEYPNLHSINSREDFLGGVYESNMDTLSLRSRAAKAMIEFDRERAMSMFMEIPRPQLPGCKCTEALIPEATLYYEALKAILQDGFSPTQLQEEADLQLLTSHLDEFNSPMQIAPLAEAITQMKPTAAQFEMLLSHFTSSLVKLTTDDRSFSYSLKDGQPNFSFVLKDLLKTAKTNGVRTDETLEALRNYLVRHLTATRCKDNLPEYLPPTRSVVNVTWFNDLIKDASTKGEKAIAPINIADLKPSSVLEGMVVTPYYSTPHAKAAMLNLQKLVTGPDYDPDKAMPDDGPLMLTIEKRETRAWQRMQNDLLKEMSEWRPEHESSEADYYNQKSTLLCILTVLTPPGPQREEARNEYLAFIKLGRFAQVSRGEWVIPVLLGIHMATETGTDLQSLILGIRNSGDPTLTLFARLQELIPEQNSR